MIDVLTSLRERARTRRARIVLPETADPRTVQARALLERDRLCDVVWVDDPARDPRLRQFIQSAQPFPPGQADKLRPDRSRTPAKIDRHHLGRTQRCGGSFRSRVWVRHA